MDMDNEKKNAPRGKNNVLGCGTLNMRVVKDWDSNGGGLRAEAAWVPLSARHVRLPIFLFSPNGVSLFFFWGGGGLFLQRNTRRPLEEVSRRQGKWTG